MRRLTYLLIRELAKSAQDVIMMTSSLTQDMVSKSEPFIRAGAVRALGSIIDVIKMMGLYFELKYISDSRRCCLQLRDILSRPLLTTISW